LDARAGIGLNSTIRTEGKYACAANECVSYRACESSDSHFDEGTPGGYKLGFADPTNTFHEKAILCRAAENTCYFASVNCAAAGSATTSAIARPDGTLLAFQPYGIPGLLLADLDLAAATGLLARRYQPAQGEIP